MSTRKILIFMEKQIGSTKIFYENISIIEMSRNPAFYSFTKYAVYHFILNLTVKEEIQFKNHRRNQPTANALTKSFEVKGVLIFECFKVCVFGFLFVASFSRSLQYYLEVFYLLFFFKFFNIII